MAIERQHGKVIFICDDCGEECETGEKDFDLALIAMKAEGWNSVKDDDDGEWKHYCAECC